MYVSVGRYGLPPMTGLDFRRHAHAERTIKVKRMALTQATSYLQLYVTAASLLHKSVSRSFDTHVRS